MAVERHFVWWKGLEFKENGGQSRDANRTKAKSGEFLSYVRVDVT